MYNNVQAFIYVMNLNGFTCSLLTHCPFNLLVQICCNVRKWLLLVSERFDFVILHDGVGYDFY